MGFSFGRLGHAPGVGLGGTVGDEWSKKIFSEIQPDFVCELLTSMAHATSQFFGPHPLGPWGGAKRSNIIKSQSQSQFPNFLKPNFVCLNINERYKTYQTGFLSVAMVMPQGWELGVPREGGGGMGVQNYFFHKFNQIWCVSYFHEWHMQRHNLFGPRLLGPWGGAKMSNIIKS